VADVDSDAFEMMDDVLADFSVDELREFLEADLTDVPVDPEFKERLRRQLWELVENRATHPASNRGPKRQPN
jgi:hypothetical protein